MIVFHYAPEQNPGGDHIDGVPLRDLTERDIASLPPHVLAAIEASAWFERVGPGAFAPPAVIEAAGRAARRHREIAVKDDSAAADVAASTDIQEG